jgi:hypothetical protein
LFALVCHERTTRQARQHVSGVAVEIEEQASHSHGVSTCIIANVDVVGNLLQAAVDIGTVATVSHKFKRAVTLLQAELAVGARRVNNELLALGIVVGIRNSDIHAAWQAS